jgi:hypothetical protein
VEFICNLIKNIGFILSLSFLVFLLKFIYAFYLNFVRNKVSLIEKKYIKTLIVIPQNIILIIIAILKFFIYIFISYAKFILGKEMNILNF